MDTAIANATEAVLLSDGYGAVNIDRVARHAGTTRAAVYRRAKTRGELIVGLLVSRFGVDPAPDSGSLREDLRLIQGLQRDFFNDPVIRAALAGVLGDAHSDNDLAAVFYERFMAPRRASVTAMLDRAADRGEIPQPTQPRIVSDLLTGPLLLRAVMPPIGPIDGTLLDATVEAALNACAPMPRPADENPSSRRR
ncbi:MAG: TetR/AcrR family transcriptional regulator [Mycobacterium sp.]|nr:MAG: TetR/AcrR family transcriptional regulator [Mycobacterium sp.]